MKIMNYLYTIYNLFVLFLYSKHFNVTVFLYDWYLIFDLSFGTINTKFEIFFFFFSCKVFSVHMKS